MSFKFVLSFSRMLTKPEQEGVPLVASGPGSSLQVRPRAIHRTSGFSLRSLTQGVLAEYPPTYARRFSSQAAYCLPAYARRFGRQAVHCPLSTVYCPLSTVYCPLSTVHCLLPTVHCPLSTVHCLPSTVDLPTRGASAGKLSTASRPSITPNDLSEYAIIRVNERCRRFPFFTLQNEHLD
jgi:hypothetical protein